METNINVSPNIGIMGNTGGVSSSDGAAVPSFNEQYELLAQEAIGDAFYSDQSYRGRIASLRHYAEVIIRKLIGRGKETKLTLGDRKVTNAIAALPDHKFIEQAMFIVRDLGDKATHSEYTEEITEQDYKKMTDAVFDLLASLLINYFAKHKFGFGDSGSPEGSEGSNGISYCLSLLPPIIRWKVLKYLYDNPDNVSDNVTAVDGKENIALIDKLFLAITKAHGKDAALTWLEEHKIELENLKVIDRSFYEKAKREKGKHFVLMVYGKYEDAKTMYQSCMEKSVNVGGSVYTTFEEAKPTYELYKSRQEDLKRMLRKIEQTGRIEGLTGKVEGLGSQPGGIEIADLEGAGEEFLSNLRSGIANDEFIDLMDFLYLGRQSEGEAIEPVMTVKVEMPKVEDTIGVMMHGNVVRGNRGEEACL